MGACRLLLTPLPAARILSMCRFCVSCFCFCSCAAGGIQTQNNAANLALLDSLLANSFATWKVSLRCVCCTCQCQRRGCVCCSCTYQQRGYVFCSCQRQQFEKETPSAPPHCELRLRNSQPLTPAAHRLSSGITRQTATGTTVRPCGSSACRYFTLTARGLARLPCGQPDHLFPTHIWVACMPCLGARLCCMACTQLNFLCCYEVSLTQRCCTFIEAYTCACTCRQQPGHHRCHRAHPHEAQGAGVLCRA